MRAHRQPGYLPLSGHHIDRQGYRRKKTGGPLMKLFETAGRANRARYLVHSLAAPVAFVLFIMLLAGIYDFMEQRAKCWRT
ncbi:MAG: hypothetical protein WAN46_01485 [Gammaproteobacteria bacterium]|jgi:hypothetical protein